MKANTLAVISHNAFLLIEVPPPGIKVCKTFLCFLRMGSKVHIPSLVLINQGTVELWPHFVLGSLAAIFVAIFAAINCNGWKFLFPLWDLSLFQGKRINSYWANVLCVTYWGFIIDFDWLLWISTLANQQIAFVRLGQISWRFSPFMNLIHRSHILGAYAANTAWPQQ